jgi:hypothetical protein
MADAEALWLTLGVGHGGWALRNARWSPLRATQAKYPAPRLGENGIVTGARPSARHLDLLPVIYR